MRMYLAEGSGEGGNRDSCPLPYRNLFDGVYWQRYTQYTRHTFFQHLARNLSWCEGVSFVKEWLTSEGLLNELAQPHLSRVVTGSYYEEVALL